MKIPLVDLSVQHREIADQIEIGMARVMESGAFILGPPVAEFEEAYATFCGARHCIGVGNGGDALELVLRALGVGPGDEVVLPANTYIASALAVTRAGATPVLVDCDSAHQLIDVEAAIAAVGPRTRALMAVDLFGRLAPLEALEEIARERGIALVEDAAQAQGARRSGRSAGCFGAAAGTSFYPGKNLGAYGDAGAVTTDRDDLAECIRRMRNYGAEHKFRHEEQGWNSRLDTLQAVVLLAKLERLPAWNEQRRIAARFYRELLAELERVVLPGEAPGEEHVWHLYPIRIPSSARDRVFERMQAEGIGVGIHYPIPIHLQGAFAHLGYGPGDFPAAEAAAGELLSLPIFPGIERSQQERVAEVLRSSMG